jgi:hypothetical protein
MKLLIAIVSISMLAGCATVRESYSADGRKAYALNCSGTARGWDKCFSAAGELCKASGYDVLERNGEPVSFAQSSASGSINSYGGSWRGSSSEVSTAERSMLIACKVPK